MCTNGTIRLVGGSTPFVGTLEVCVAGCWGTVCGNDFDTKDASVACRQLGLPAFGELSYCCTYNNRDVVGQEPLHNMMVTMDMAQDLYGCTVLTAAEMSPHCLTVLTMSTVTTTMSIPEMTMTSVTTVEILELYVQVIIFVKVHVMLTIYISSKLQSLYSYASLQNQPLGVWMEMFIW